MSERLYKAIAPQPIQPMIELKILETICYAGNGDDECAYTEWKVQEYRKGVFFTSRSFCRLLEALQFAKETAELFGLQNVPYISHYAGVERTLFYLKYEEGKWLFMGELP